MKERKSEHSVPYIRGYRKFNNASIKEFRKIVSRDKENFRTLLKEIEIESLSERSEKMAELRTYLESLLKGWLSYETMNLLGNFLFDTKINVYDLGVYDGKEKIVDAVRKYKGQYENRKEEVIRAIRDEEIQVSLEEKYDMGRTILGDVEAYEERFRSSFASVGAGILILQRIGIEEKKKRMDRLVDEYFRENRPGIGTLKTIGSTLVVAGLIRVFDRLNASYVRWVVNAPIDTPCIMATGEIRRYGEPFSNGFIKPQVHKNCQCSLEEVGITDIRMDELIRNLL